jgi:hypothetical protein
MPQSKDYLMVILHCVAVLCRLRRCLLFPCLISTVLIREKKPKTKCAPYSVCVLIHDDPTMATCQLLMQVTFILPVLHCVHYTVPAGDAKLLTGVRAGW